MTRYMRRQWGAISVEFAVLAPVLFLLLILCLEVGRVELARVLLERALYDISYQVRLAQGADVEGISARVLAANSHFLFDPSDVVVTATHAESVSGLLVGAAGAGGAGQVVQLELQANLGVLRLLRDRDATPYRLTMLTVNEAQF